MFFILSTCKKTNINTKHSIIYIIGVSLNIDLSDAVKKIINNDMITSTSKKMPDIANNVLVSDRLKKLVSTRLYQSKRQILATYGKRGKILDKKAPILHKNI